MKILVLINLQQDKSNFLKLLEFFYYFSAKYIQINKIFVLKRCSIFHYLNAILRINSFVILFLLFITSSICFCCSFVTVIPSSERFLAICLLTFESIVIILSPPNSNIIQQSQTTYRQTEFVLS